MGDGRGYELKFQCCACGQDSEINTVRGWEPEGHLLCEFCEAWGYELHSGRLYRRSLAPAQFYGGSFDNPKFDQGKSTS